jgi:type II secretion system protein G
MGFTLIELLIVIAIILILIAIALPNFLEAQIRARVTKAKGEIRSLVTALESYYLDFKFYPAESEHNALTGNRPRSSAGLTWLTSPIAYITAIPEDPFGGAELANDPGDSIITYETGGVRTTQLPMAVYGCLEMYAIFSRGPGGDESISSAHPNYKENPSDSVFTYAPTNGTKSLGDIFHYGGDGFFIGIPVTSANRAQAKAASPTPLLVNGVPYLRRLPPGIF